MPVQYFAVLTDLNVSLKRLTWPKMTLFIFLLSVVETCFASEKKTFWSNGISQSLYRLKSCFDQELHNPKLKCSYLYNRQHCKSKMSHYIHNKLWVYYFYTKLLSFASHFTAVNVKTKVATSNFLYLIEVEINI